MKQRIFHTIGQGAFYSERHENFNIVFDCGTEWKNRTKSMFDKVVTQSFKKDESIDILFISHFDYDHISKIGKLKESVKEIKAVVLPLLHDNEKILLSNVYRVLEINLLPLINNPEEYFGEQTKIIYVRPTGQSETPIDENDNAQNIDELEPNATNGKVEIESGSKISLNGLENWIFIPYNNNYISNHSDLINELKAEGFDTDKFVNDPDYILDKIIEDVSTSKSNGGKKIKEIYDRLNGKVNQNSMFLYSGPRQNNQLHKHCFLMKIERYFHHRFFHHRNWFEKVGCVYTGDGDLNIVDISLIYRNYWRYVGTVQIPHHGDIKSFNNKILNDKHFCCPISAGKFNSYGHPSNAVISEILSFKCFPMIITEELDSVYVEIIE